MIACPICQKECKQLTAQHIFKHKITIEEFKRQYPNISLGNANAIAMWKARKERNVIQDNIRCLQCNKLITSPFRKTMKFCSHSCSATYVNLNGCLKTKVCLYCKKEYKTKFKNSKYCSRDCYKKNKLTRVKVICNQCNKEFETYKCKMKQQYHFCCNNCKNTFFKINGHLRGTFAGYNGSSKSTYRNKAFECFEHKCYYCGYDKNMSILQVHHLDKNRKNNDISNLRIVCPTHHAELHFDLLNKLSCSTNGNATRSERVDSRFEF